MDREVFFNHARVNVCAYIGIEILVVCYLITLIRAIQLLKLEKICIPWKKYTATQYYIFFLNTLFNLFSLTEYTDLIREFIVVRGLETTEEESSLQWS